MWCSINTDLETLYPPSNMIEIMWSRHVSDGLYCGNLLGTRMHTYTNWCKHSVIFSIFHLNFDIKHSVISISVWPLYGCMSNYLEEMYTYMLIRLPLTRPTFMYLYSTISVGYWKEPIITIFQPIRIKSYIVHIFHTVLLVFEQVTEYL